MRRKNTNVERESSSKISQKLADYLLIDETKEESIIRVCKKNDISFLGLFGSYARGEQKEVTGNVSPCRILTIIQPSRTDSSSFWHSKSVLLKAITPGHFWYPAGKAAIFKLIVLRFAQSFVNIIY